MAGPASVPPEEVTDFCGGAIISQWHVLTAAHCVHMARMGRPFRPNELKVRMGYTHRTKSAGGLTYGVKKIFTHEGFNASRIPPFRHDVALLVLDEKIAISEYVNPVCLPDADALSRVSVSTCIDIRQLTRSQDCAECSSAWTRARC